MPSILTAPVISNVDSPVVHGLMSGVTRIADAMARAKAVEAQKADREESRLLRADETNYRRGRDAVSDQRYQTEQGRQHLADVEAGRAAPASPVPAEMAAAERGATSRQDAAAKARRSEGAKLWAQINDEALKHGRDSATTRNESGQQVGYDPRRATRAYADFWKAQLQAMPRHLRELVDEIGTEQAMQVPGVAEALGRGTKPPADEPEQPGVPEEPDQGGLEPLQPVPSSRTSREPGPQVRNFGTDLEPNWRQWDPSRREWGQPKMATSPTQPAAGETPVSDPAGDGGGSVMSLRRSGQPGVHSVGDLLGGVVDGWDPNRMEAMTPEQLGIRPAGDAAVPDPLAFQKPGWREAKIDLGGVNQWHDLSKQAPDQFAQQLMQLKAAGDPRYRIIVDELRARAAGASPAGP